MLQHTSMTRRLVLWFLLIAIAPVLIAVVVIYFQRADSIQNEAYSKLTAIRDLKVRKLEWWLEHCIDDMQTMAEHLRAHGLEVLLEKGADAPPEGIRSIRRVLEPYAANYEDYRELSVIDARTGRAWVSTKPEREGMDRSTRAYFTEPMATKQLYMSHIYMSPTERIPVMEFAVPVFCDQHAGQHVAAILAARIDLKSSLYRLLGERVGLGNTGETVLIDRERLVLNELRWHDDAPLRLTLQDEAARRAARGEAGVLEAKDYRDVPVFSAYAHVSTTGWAMVVKQDLAELHAPIDRMIWQLVLAVLLLACVVTVAAVLLARSTTAPVLAIAEVAQKIRRGDVTARCSTDRRDELAAMGRSINEMADSLVAQAAVQRSVAEVSETMVVASSIPEFASRLLGTLMRVTSSHLAGFFRCDRERPVFHHVTSVGLHADLVHPFRADILEGQLGEVLRSREISYLEELGPDTAFRFKTVVGDAVPGELAEIPLLVRDRVVAVIVLGTLTRYGTEHREILRLGWAGANVAYANLLASEKSDRMAEELRTRNQELAETNRALELQSERLQRQADELTKLAAELDVRRAQVEEAGRLKSEFLSNMSHELRTPLNSIIALSQLISSRGAVQGREKDAEFVKIIERNGRELLALINDILDLSKIEAGRLDVQAAAVDLRRVVDAAVETIMPAVEEKGLTLDLQVSAAPEIQSDAGRIRQILLNLLSNAVKFTNSGRIDISLDADDQSVFLAVSDTGIGIAQSDLEIIFDEFRQIDGTTTRSHGGSGLGLAICAKLASLLGGSISVVSDPGRGSTFTLTLPRRSEAEEAADGPLERRSRPRAQATEPRRTVLVIDDDQSSREVLRSYLTEAGFDVAVARGGAEGLRLARSLRPFAITLDVFMPGMDGWEVLHQLKRGETTARIPVLIVSVSADRGTGIALGAIAHIVKPVDRGELLRELERIAATREIERILVVDDDPTARELIAGVVRERYGHVDQAAGGIEALRLARTEPRPDAVILDLIMPDMDGFAVIDNLRHDRSTRDLPVIIVTAKDLSSADHQRLRESAQQIVRKGGMDRRRLLHELGTALESLRGAPRPPPAPALAAPPSPAAPRHSAGDHVVLVVEDNRDNMVTIGAILDELGVAHTGASDGEQAVRMAAELRPGMILMDIQLPRMSGLEAAQAIKQQPALRDIPIVALTARAMKGDREHILDAGCDDYLAKPIEPAQLQAAIHRWLDGRDPN